MKTVTLPPAGGPAPPGPPTPPSPRGRGRRADIQKTLGFVPQFFLKFPEVALPGAWEEMKSLQLNPHTALPGRPRS